ncbi:vanadium-dependent haloperoxidase [Streptomyces sp. NPDC002779]|uniref:vanadium-dependent haloperoxidase n=1 Tax=Streptomyces sp. NPDC002779 TaxID=3364664 RepID=UPI0036CC0D20
MKPLHPQAAAIRRSVVFCAVAALAFTATTGYPATAGSRTASGAAQSTEQDGDNVVLLWNQQILDALTTNNHGSSHPTPPPVGGRTLAIVHNAIYDAWAAYDRKAVGTRFGDDLRRPLREHTRANKRKAVSFAAHRALCDLFPQQRETFDAKLRALGYDPAEAESADRGTPVSVALQATDAILEARHHDGSQQLASPPYAVPDGVYEPVNPPQDVAAFDKSKIVDVNHWVPLTVDGMTHHFLTPQFASVKPFLVDDVDSYLPAPPPKYGSAESRRAIAEQEQINANLTERQKAIAEYWLYRDVTSSSIPQKWASFVSKRDRHGLDDDVKMFFALNMAAGDTAVVTWKTKVHFDYGRPITMIRYTEAGKKIRGYAGPGKGTQTIDGSKWQPYLKTPAFGAYGSGHTGSTATGAEILKRFTGSDAYGGKGLVKAGSSTIEAGMPTNDVKLTWPTFSAAAQEIGYSRIWGGVHWTFDHHAAAAQGREVARDVWAEAQQYFNGTHR